MEIIDKLFRKIDDELLYLSQASASKSNYSHFDFKQALKMLNAEFQKNGYNPCYKIKASQYIHVFNDLCNTQAEVFSYRDLSFNKTTNEIESEQFSYNLITHVNKVEIVKVVCIDELIDFYSKLDLPEEITRLLFWTCKFDYLISGCKSQNYDRFEIDVKNTKMDNFSLDFCRFFTLLKKEDKFDNTFEIDLNFVSNHRIDFNAYVKNLQGERRVESELENSNTILDENPEVDLIINKLVPLVIDREQTTELREFITNGRIKKNRIEIKGKYQTFHDNLFPFINLIPTKYNKSWYDLILNNFTRNEKDIPKTTISSAKTNQK